MRQNHRRQAFLLAFLVGLAAASSPMEKLLAEPLILLEEAKTVEIADAEKTDEKAKTESESEFTDTHEQSAVIKVGGEDAAPNSLHTFCLNSKGELLAGIGAGPGEIQFYSPQGELLRSWPVPVKPEAINLNEAGELLIAGDGELLKLNDAGEIILRVEAPHAAAAKSGSEKMREQIVTQLKSRTAAYANMVNVYQKQIDTISEKDEEDQTAAETTRLAALKRAQESMKKYIAEHPPREPTEEEIEAQIKAMASTKIKASSISASGEDIFIATRGTTGYGFSVWRTNAKFEEGEEIITQLRGCCGQMDVQACETGIYVAENSRHRVSRYDRNGEPLKHFGERTRTGVTGFGSCCNPMNLCFGAGGEVYTAESNLGRIKRYSPTGELLDLIGSVKLVPGCKKVSIAVSDDGKYVYMLDITRNHIVVMTRVAS